MFAYSIWLWIPRRSFLMSFIMCSSHVHLLSTQFTKQNAATFTKQNAPPAKKPKSDDLRRQNRSRRTANLFMRGCVNVFGARRFDFGIWNREIWCWKSILEWPHHWPLQWEVPFGMGLSFYDIVIAATARADAKFGFLEAATQSTIIVYGFVKCQTRVQSFKKM